MPVHDWTRVEAGIFHAFHVAWVPEIQKALNTGLLPDGFYALAEQHYGRSIADVLTLHASAPDEQLPALPPDAGGIAVADAPPKVRRKRTVSAAALSRRRTLAIRHVSGHRLVALVEIVSPANKDRAQHVEEFSAKAAEALAYGIHLLIVDLFPPGLHDPDGIHAMILSQLDDAEKPDAITPGEPVSLAAYVAGPPIHVYTEFVAVGAGLPEMPLFLNPDRYVNVPLEATYRAAYDSVPAFWRNLLET